MAKKKEVAVYYVGGGDAKIVGEETNRVYWFKEGKPTMVNPDDATLMLEQTVTRSCCGSEANRTYHLFQTK